MAQPHATRLSPLTGSTSAKRAAMPGATASGLERLVVQHAGRHAVAAGHEGPVLVGAVDAEALGQPTPPGPLLAGRLVVGAGHDVIELEHPSGTPRSPKGSRSGYR